MGELLGAAAIAFSYRIVHKAVHNRDDDNKLATESYDTIERCNMMAMLVHGCYYRDLNRVEEVTAWCLEYDNERALNYGKYCWEPHKCEAKESELKKFGLAFLRKKSTHSNPNAPDLVIVLRGTIPTRPADLAADWKIGIQQFDHTDRVLRILELILAFHRDNPRKRICMAGHSLGAATALIVGGCLYATYKINIDTHLFNPPLLTLLDAARGFPPATPSEDCCTFKLMFSKLKEALVRFDPVAKAALNKEWEQFQRLKDWIPHIYLNPGDPISRQYIAYYKSREGQPVQRPEDLISPQGVIGGLFLSGLFSDNVKYLKNIVPTARLFISTWSAKPKWYAKIAPGAVKEVVAGRLPHSLRQWHKYTKEYIELKEHHACLLQRPYLSQPTVSPRILDYSYLSE